MLVFVVLLFVAMMLVLDSRIAGRVIELEQPQLFRLSLFILFNCSIIEELTLDGFDACLMLMLSSIASAIKT